MSELPAVGRSATRVLTVGRVLCAVPFLYLASIAGYALLNFVDFAGAAPQFVRYIAAPLALACFFLWGAISRGGARAAAIGAYGCAVLAGLFLHEAVATSRLTRSVSASLASMHENTEATAVFRQTLPPGVTARGLAFEFDHNDLKTVLLGGIPFRETLLCSGDSDNLISYRADRFGFNNPDEVYSAGALDVAIFGDSFVEGMCLKPGDDVATRVRSSLPRTASFGFRGAGPMMELAALGRFGPALRPKLSVIVYYAGNDWENLEVELRQPWLRPALDGEARFGEAGVTASQIARAEEVVEKLWRDDAENLERYRARVLRNFFALSQTWLTIGLHYPAAPKAQPEFETIVVRMRDLAASWGGEVLFIYVPRAERFRGGFDNDFVFDQARAPFFTAIEKAGVSAIDLVEHMETDADPISFFAQDGHFSAKGANFLASLIIDYADDRFDDVGEPELAVADADEEL